MTLFNNLNAANSEFRKVFNFAQMFCPVFFRDVHYWLKAMLSK